MEWEFSVDQVVRGEVDYGLEEFRRDLANEVAANVDSADEAHFRHVYGLVYDLCYALATGRDGRDFVHGFAFDPPTVAFLESLVETMQPNAVMLGAILQRLIAGHMEDGTPLEVALDRVATEHLRLAGAAPPPFAPDTRPTQ